MRAALLVVLMPFCALASPVSVSLAPDRKSHLQFNGDLGLTASGLPTARAEMVVATSGVLVRVAPLGATSAGRWLDNGAAAHGWHSAWDSEDWRRAWQLRPMQGHLAFRPLMPNWQLMPRFRLEPAWIIPELTPMDVRGLRIAPLKAPLLDPAR